MGTIDEVGGTDAQHIEASFVDPEGFAVLFERHPMPLHRYIVTRVGRRGVPSIIDATTKPATTDA